MNPGDSGTSILYGDKRLSIPSQLHWISLNSYNVSERHQFPTNRGIFSLECMGHQVSEVLFSLPFHAEAIDVRMLPNIPWIGKVPTRSRAPLVRELALDPRNCGNWNADFRVLNPLHCVRAGEDDSWQQTRGPSVD